MLDKTSLLSLKIASFLEIAVFVITVSVSGENSLTCSIKTLSPDANNGLIPYSLAIEASISNSPYALPPILKY